MRHRQGMPHPLSLSLRAWVTMSFRWIDDSMLGHRKHSFARAHLLLRRLGDNLEDLEALRELQMLLLREVVRSEEKIRRHKVEVRGIEGPGVVLNAKRFRYLTNRIEGYRRSAYIWRSFGDAIAFLYLDRFSLKHCFYSTETTSPKQDAGFILGKEGFANELVILDSALKHGIPALLVDLTNTIRHGDVCLLGKSDPFLIEAKLGKNLNSRGKRQKRNLEKLHSFYETDKSVGLRGFPELQRRSTQEPETTYIDLLNECILEAREKGHAFRQPEAGLHYVVLTNDAPQIDVVLEKLGLQNAILPFFLNDHKAQRTWAPYFPFVLFISSADQLWDFIQGSLFILVFVEADAICKIARDEGHQAAFDADNENFPLGIETSNGGQIRISSHMLNRIGLDFLSPRWIVRSSLERPSVVGPEDPETGVSREPGANDPRRSTLRVSFGDCSVQISQPAIHFEWIAGLEPISLDKSAYGQLYSRSERGKLKRPVLPLRKEDCMRF